MTPDEIDRLYDAVMLAAPMAAVGVVMFLAVWLWPIRGRK
jgi:peroxiredoxin family protein